MTFHNPSGGADMRRLNIDAFIVRLVARRAEAEYLAERLIEALDAADGDPDLEPSFGYLPNGAVLDECEADVDEETLGWPAGHSQLHLGNNTADGDETALERHGMGFLRSGPDDHEPWLGAPEINATCTANVCGPDGRWRVVCNDQTRWAQGTCDDREEVNEDGCDMQGSDNGIADHGGVADQWGGTVARQAYV